MILISDYRFFLSQLNNEEQTPLELGYGLFGYEDDAKDGWNNFLDRLLNAKVVDFLIVSTARFRHRVARHECKETFDSFGKEIESLSGKKS